MRGKKNGATVDGRPFLRVAIVVRGFTCGEGALNHFAEIAPSTSV
jgi:hypothetical protein